MKIEKLDIQAMIKDIKSDYRVRSGNHMSYDDVILAVHKITEDKINEIIEYLNHKEEEKAKIEQFDPQDTMMPDY